MRRPPLPAFAFAFVFAFGGIFAAACSAQLDDAKTAHRKGEYDQAIAIYRRATGANANESSAWIGLARALAETGKYTDAEQSLRSAPQTLSVALSNTLGDVLAAQGKLSDAEAAYRTAVQQRAADSLTARLNLAILRFNRGDYGALNDFDTFIDIYNKGPRLTSDELMAVATAVRYLGVRDPQLFKDALKAFDEAVARDQTNDEARLRTAELFLEKYDAAQAEEAFGQLLAINPNHPRALLGMARSKEFDGSPEATELAKKALEINPNLIGAHVMLARAALGVEDSKLPLEEAGKAVAVNPSSLEALTALAAAQFFHSDRNAFEATKQKILALNPRYAELYSTLADISVQTRQYSRAVDLAREGIALDSTAWRAYGLLGINLMRLGEIAEGRKNLEVAFKGDPYNVWFKNTLDLLDTMGKFREVDIGRFRIAADPRESDLLAPYVAALGEEAYQKLSARYKMQLPSPIRVELFFSHADFSVRTLGLPGLGALGAAFGNVVVLDSPSAREAGEFNWGTTLWHELSHSFHLALSDFKVPRWLTEGLAVLEERRARPGWGDDVDPGFIWAYKQKKLLPVSEMNKGFVRPAYPEQIGYSYYQASLVAEMIEQQNGFDAILNMLRAYKTGQSNDEVIRTVLKTEPKAFDDKFDQYLRQKYSRQIAAVKATEKREMLVDDPSDYAVQLLMAQDMIENKKYDEAIPFLNRAKFLFPEHAGADSPYALLALIYKEKGDLVKAAAELEQMTALNETSYEANLQLADLYEKQANSVGAAAALERAIYIYPMQPLLHTRLAALYKNTNVLAKVVRERQALVALNPTDRAEAYYQLALAHFEAGNTVAARREVVRALEEAPNFEKAQELLLKLRGTRP